MDDSTFLDALTRRDVIRGVGGTLTLGALSGGTLAQTANADPAQSVAFLLGTQDADPNTIDALAPGGGYFSGQNWEKTHYAYIYQQPNGAQWYITQDDSAWTPLTFTNYQIVSSASDLPAPTNGTHTLDRSVYWFNGFVTSPYGLDISNSPALLGRHGSMDGFIHTGQNTAITGTDGGLYMRNLYVHAPGGTLFGISADQTTEMLVESSSFSDAAGIAPISSLGTITGYRVPTFKACNFEDFADGLTFDGSPDKVLVGNSPLRNVVAPGATILNFPASFDTEIIQLKGNYIKSVQPDTEVVRVDPSSVPREVFQYIDTTHDGSVVKANILTGGVGSEAVGSNVTNSFPLADSGESGELDLDAPTTVTGSGAAPTEIADGNITSTTTLNNVERTSNPVAGRIQYDGRKDRKASVHALVSVSGANTEFSLSIGLNGTLLDRSEVRGFLPNNANPVGVAALSEVRLTNGDYVSAYLENTGGSMDLTAETFALTV